MHHSYVTWLIHTCNDPLKRLFFETQDMTHSYVNVTWRIYVWYDLFIRDIPHSCVTRLIHLLHYWFICHITDSYVKRLIQKASLRDTWPGSLICDMTCSYETSFVTQLIHTCHDSFIRDMAHSYKTWLIHVRHDSFMCDMTHSYVTWLIHVWNNSLICDMTHWYVTWLIHVWHGSFTCDTTHSCML